MRSADCHRRGWRPNGFWCRRKRGGRGLRVCVTSGPDYTARGSHPVKTGAFQTGGGERSGKWNTDNSRRGPGISNLANCHSGPGNGSGGGGGLKKLRFQVLQPVIPRERGEGKSSQKSTRVLREENEGIRRKSAGCGSGSLSFGTSVADPFTLRRCVFERKGKKMQSIVGGGRVEVGGFGGGGPWNPRTNRVTIHNPQKTETCRGTDQIHNRRSNTANDPLQPCTRRRMAPATQSRRTEHPCTETKQEHHCTRSSGKTHSRLSSSCVTGGKTGLNNSKRKPRKRGHGQNTEKEKNRRKKNKTKLTNGLGPPCSVEKNRRW